MPRVTNTGEEVKIWAERTGEIPTWWDLCFECADSERDTANAFGDDLGVNEPWGVDREPQGVWEIGAEHPPYDQEEYSCEICSKKLTGNDD